MNYASTYPIKSEKLTRGLIDYFEKNRHLSGEGRNMEGLGEGRIMVRARLALAEFFGAEIPSHVLFSGGVTSSINMILNGLLKNGDHVLSTGLEHNSVARPLELLRKKGIITVDFLPCSPEGFFDPSLIKKHVQPNTRLLVMTHGSNVLGTVLPAAECFAEAKQFGLFTLLDTAQTAGVIPVAMDDNTSALAFTGHKGLGALQGTGGFVLNKDAARQIDPWLTGGTGSASEFLLQPEFLPDKFESGTQNIPGILSLALAVEERLSEEPVKDRYTALTNRFLEGARNIPRLVIHGPGKAEHVLPIVSVSSPGIDAACLARDLYEGYGVITRPGLHCAPLAHQCAGTFPAGTLRFSFGPETSGEDIDAALNGLESLLCK